MPTETRRAHDRIDVSFELRLRHGDREAQARCLNISQGGMFIEVEEPIQIGEVITATFLLPDHPKPIAAEARVCWSERTPKRGVGVKFIGLRAIEVWAINQLFRRKSRGEM